jgi:hypothetical protein
VVVMAAKAVMAAMAAMAGWPMAAIPLRNTRLVSLRDLFMPAIM